MAAPTIFRSSDTSAPTLDGTSGSLVAVLDGCLVNGYAGNPTPLGWGHPFTAANKAVYRAASGVRHYLDVNDASPNGTALGRNAFVRPYEAMTAVGTGTNPWPTATQATQCVIPKSTSADGTARPWLLIGDALTFIFVSSASGTNPPNLGSSTWGMFFYFGEMFSALSGDLYRSFCMWPTATATQTTDVGRFSVPADDAGTGAVNQNMPRTYLATGTSIWATVIPNVWFPQFGGTRTFPNQVDGGFYLNAYDLAERGTSATGAVATNTFGIRGRPRGLYQNIYNVTSLNDQDTFTGVGDFAGKTFMVLKFSATTGVIVETTQWASST